MLQDEDDGTPQYPYRSAAGVVTGEAGCYQAWRKPNQWTSRRIGGYFPVLQDAIDALEGEAKSEQGAV